MRLTDIKPDTVYALTSDDRTSAATNYGGTIYARTANVVETDVKVSRSWGRGETKTTRVKFYDVPGLPGQYSDEADGVTHNLRTLRGSFDLRRGLSIRHEVCKVSEWPQWMADRIAKAAEQAKAMEARQEERRTCWARIGAALEGIGIDANTTRASLKAVVSAVNRAGR